MSTTCKTCPFMQLASTIRPAAQMALAGFDDSSHSIGAVIKLLLAAKTLANCRPCYLKSLRQYLTRFAKGRESRALSEFTASDVETILAQQKSASARQTWLNRISTLFSFAVRRGYIDSNPCDRIERIHVEQRPPKILTPEQAELLMKTASEVCKPYLILGLYAGIRPEELLHLTWNDVSLESKTVTVNHSKTRRRRIVPLEPKAVALLSACKLKSGKISPSNSTMRRCKRKCRAVLGFADWPADVLRHSAASYLLALHKDAGKVAATLGNSPSVLLSHYHEPVTEDDAARFWK